MNQALLVPLFAFGVCWWIGPASAQDAKPELADFRTTATAITAKIGKPAAERPAQPGILGILVTEMDGPGASDHQAKHEERGRNRFCGYEFF